MRDLIYQFEIYDSTSNDLVFTAMTKDTFMILDLENIYFEDQASFYWRVSAKNSTNEALQSATHFFHTLEGKKQKILLNLGQSTDYQKADEIEKKLMQSLAFEENGLIYSCQKKYQELLQQYPENKLIRKLSQAFLARHDGL